jgi:hypothetical protein
VRFSDDFLLQNGMHHRYGRYGPDAWLRLRKRRMSRFTRMLVRSEYSAVIRARFRLDEGERIFIVEITPLDGENEKSVPPKVMQLPPDPFGSWRERARIVAYNKLHEDLDRYEEPSPDEQLPVIARNLGRKELGNFPGITEKGKTIPELMDIFVGTFTEIFQELIQEERNRGMIKDKTALAVKRRARLDRSLSLSDEQLPIYGAIQAVHELLEIDVPSRYFRQIEELAEAYRQAYRDSKEVMQDFRNPFPR